MIQLNLFKKFISFRFIAFLLTGIIISFAVTTHIKNDKLQSINESALLALDTVIKPNLTPSDFTAQLTLEEKDLLHDQTAS